MHGVVSAKGMRRIAWVDMPGGGQVRGEGRWAYVGHMRPPHGTTILDMEDPRNPRIVTTIPLATDASHTHKVRIAGDIMITNVEQDERHAKRRAKRIPAATAKLRAALGREPTDAEIAAEIGTLDKVAAAQPAEPRRLTPTVATVVQATERTTPSLVGATAFNQTPSQAVSEDEVLW